MYPHRIHLRDPWQAVALADSITYRRVFRWPTELMPYEQLWLVVGGVDSPYRVKLNRQDIGQQSDRRLPLEMNISSLVQNQNLVELCCTPEPNQTFRGLTRSICLEVRRSIHLQQLIGKVIWNDSRPMLKLTAKLTSSSERRLSVVVRLNDREVLYQDLDSLQLFMHVTTPVLDVPAWFPGLHNELQQLEIQLLDPACLLAQYHFLTGFSHPAQSQEMDLLPADEALVDSPWLESADRQGRGVQVICNDSSAYRPYLWFHPCVKEIRQSM